MKNGGGIFYKFIWGVDVFLFLWVDGCLIILMLVRIVFKNLFDCFFVSFMWSFLEFFICRVLWRFFFCFMFNRFLCGINLCILLCGIRKLFIWDFLFDIFLIIWFVFFEVLLVKVLMLSVFLRVGNNVLFIDRIEVNRFLLICFWMLVLDNLIFIVFLIFCFCLIFL